MSVKATRRIQFCAGHRVHRHESKCRNLHGHNYVAYFTACAPELDRLGRVIDFGVLKEKLGGWIEKHWDHGFILWNEDTEAIGRVAGMKDQKIYLLSANPTAENMAKHLLEVGDELLAETGVCLSHVTLWETENCYAEVRR